MPRPNNGPYLSDKPNKQGMWEVRWSEGRRSRSISTGKTSRQAAIIWMAGWLKVHEEAQESTPEPDAPLAVAALMELYDQEHAAEHVFDLERVKFAAVPVRKFFGAMLPTAIDGGTVAEYSRERRSGRLGRPVKDGTIRRELQHLSAVLFYAARNSNRTHLTKDKVPTISLPPKSEARSVVATEAQLDKLLAAASLGWDAVGCEWRTAERLPRAYLFIAIARWTAGRKNAIETLPWSRVDLDRGTIDYREAGRRITKKRRVPVPISAQLMPILRRAFAEKRGLFVLGSTISIRKAFEVVVKRAGLPKTITPHVLRHSWATHAAERGVSAFTIATMLGDTLATVEANYMHRNPDHLRAALEGFDASSTKTA